MQESLVIFDCDGVLVDSERISADVMRIMSADIGLTFSTDESLALIRGRKVAEWVSEIETMAGRSLAEDFIQEFRRRTEDSFTVGLRPIPYVADVVEELTGPFCTASSAPLEKIRLTLGLTGLLPYFEGRIFSAYEVGSWKPDPGLFLHAAGEMGRSPASCVVVEDSVVGVRAAVAAGMPVMGYAPEHSGMAAALASAGAVTFSSMRELPRLLAQPVPAPR
ncbi:HAD-IA family hydrolase [Streptomyces sp. TR02-1]|uniref:HAD-IA family hydrolase n=1 Tax=Streptomyces sp. TR02-1 TaxID=3385977 RepID=UPI00399FD3E7